MLTSECSNKIYKCPRCGYNKPLKKYIKQHFNRLTPCPDRYGVDLTEEIKEIVFNNGIYHKPKQNNIKTYNIFNGIISELDPIQRIECIVKYNEKKLIGFEAQLEDHFETKIKRLEENNFSAGFFLNLDDIYKIFDNVTKINKDQPELFNVLFDKTIKRLKIYRDNEWISYLEDSGINLLVSLIKSYFLNDYELYLIKNLHQDGPSRLNRIVLREHIEIYYQFLIHFELMPTIIDLDDKELLGHMIVENNDHYISEKYMDLYYDLKKKIAKKDTLKVRRQILDIIHNNTTQNVKDLKNIIMDILKMDEEFRSEFIKIKDFDAKPLC